MEKRFISRNYKQYGVHTYLTMFNNDGILTVFGYDKNGTILGYKSHDVLFLNDENSKNVETS